MCVDLSGAHDGTLAPRARAHAHALGSALGVLASFSKRDLERIEEHEGVGQSRALDLYTLHVLRMFFWSCFPPVWGKKDRRLSYVGGR